MSYWDVSLDQRPEALRDRRESGEAEGPQVGPCSMEADKRSLLRKGCHTWLKKTKTRSSGGISVYSPDMVPSLGSSACPGVPLSLRAMSQLFLCSCSPICRQVGRVVS